MKGRVRATMPRRDWRNCIDMVDRQSDEGQMERTANEHKCTLTRLSLLGEKIGEF